MSGRPGYEELVVTRGRDVADRIVAAAEDYSDAAHQEWDVALQWAIARHDQPDDPALTAQQEENARLHRSLVERRGDCSRPILYLVNELGGDAFDHPVAQAEGDVRRTRVAARSRSVDARPSRLGGGDRRIVEGARRRRVMSSGQRSENGGYRSVVSR